MQDVKEGRIAIRVWSIRWVLLCWDREYKWCSGEERGERTVTLPTVTCSSVENIILSSSDQLNREIVFILIVIFFHGGDVAMWQNSNIPSGVQSCPGCEDWTIMSAHMSRETMRLFTLTPRPTFWSWSCLDIIIYPQIFGYQICK